MVEVYQNHMKKLSNGIENQQNKEMQVRNLTWDGCMQTVKVYLNQTEKLSNGMDGVCLNQMKELSNGTEKPLVKDLQLAKITWE
uniref:Uncharacterized protein n=1 Tax=Plectus sambesii TaxID=2011161 RepID=A0A914VJK1_9BILA